MAEVVGLVASCISVAGLAAAVFTLIEETKSFARDYQNIESDVSEAILRVNCQTDLIHCAQEALTEYCNSNRNRSARVGHRCQSSTINFLLLSHHSDFLQTESKNIRDDVYRLLDHVRNIYTKLRLVAVFAWRRLVKKGLKTIQNKLQFVQSNITLIYNVVLIEAELRRPDSERDRGRIKYLKKVIKSKEKAIKALREQRRRKGLTSADYDDSAESLLEEKGLDLVLKIAKTVRKKENLPTFVDPRPLAPQPSSPPRFSSTPDDQPSSEQKHVRFKRPHNSRTHSAAYQIEYPPQLRQRQSSSSQTESGSSVYPRTVTPASSASESQRSVSPPGTSTASTHSRSSTKGVIAAERPPITADNHHGDGDFIAVRPAEMVLKTVESCTYDLIPGLLTSLNGTTHEVSPILEPQQDFNFMTEHEASRLDLMGDVEPYDASPIDGESWIETADGRRIMPTGTVLARWSTTVGLRPITLQFWVIPEYPGERSIVLGKPYVEKASHYLASRPSRSSD